MMNNIEVEIKYSGILKTDLSLTKKNISFKEALTFCLISNDFVMSREYYVPQYYIYFKNDVLVSGSKGTLLNALSSEDLDAHDWKVFRNPNIKE